MVQQKSIKQNMILNFTRTLLSLIFPLITFPYVSRVLLPEGLGRVGFAQSIIQYFLLLAGLGINTYGIKSVAVYRTDKSKLSTFCREIFIINMISTVVSYSLFIIAILLIPRLKSDTELLCICSGTILFTTLGMEWLYSGLEDFKYITYRSFLFQLLSVIALFTFVHKKEDLLKYAAISVISNVGSNICNFVHARKFLVFSDLKPINLKQHLKPIFSFFLISSISFIYTFLDTTMLGFLSGNRQVGFYSAASKINRLVLSLLISISTVLFPRLSYYFGVDDKEKFYNLFYKSFSFILLIAIPATVGLNLLSKPIIVVFSGNEYLGAVTAMQILNPIIVEIGIGTLLGAQFYVAIGKQKITMLATSIGAITNFILNMLLIPKYGAEGAAIGSVIAEFFVTLTCLLIGIRYFSLKKAFAEAWQYILASLIMGIGVYYTKKVFVMPILKIITGVIVGFFSYSLCLYFMRNKTFRRILDIVRRKIDRRGNFLE